MLRFFDDKINHGRIVKTRPTRPERMNLLYLHGM